MKHSIIIASFAKWWPFAIILAVLPVLCLGQYRRQGRSGVSPLKIVQLAEPNLTGPVSLEQALAGRRSVRRFTGQPLDFGQIGQLAWAGQGITDRQNGFRTAPSAGAIYPMKLYFATEEGLFVYNPDGHNLEKTLDRDVRSRLARAALDQEHVAQAGCDIIVAGSVRKLAAKYRNRARRYILLEAGHIAQNIQLQAVGLKLGSVPVGAFDMNQVRKLCKLPMSLEPLYIICVGYPAEPRPSEGWGEQPAAEEGEAAEQESQLRQPGAPGPRSAVLIIASRKFRDEELFETKRVLDEAQIKTVIASTKAGLIKGVLGGSAQAEILVSELSVDDYDAIVFVGGPGAKEYFESPAALNIARQAAEKRKVLAAICIAPAVLANAGVLDGLRATSFFSVRGRLKAAGAEYTGGAVERDGLVITANGPKAANQFGRTIIEALRENER